MLRPGGMLVLIEPTHNAWVVVQRLRGQDPDEGHTQHEITWPETYLRSMDRNGLRTFWRGRQFPDTAASSKITQTIKERAMDAVRTGKRTRDPVQWLHEHIAGGDGYMVALARKDIAVNERRDARDPRRRPRHARRDPGGPRRVHPAARRPRRRGPGLTRPIAATAGA